MNWQTIMCCFDCSNFLWKQIEHIKELQDKANKEEEQYVYAKKWEEILPYYKDLVKHVDFHEANPAKTVCILTLKDWREIVGTYTKETDKYLALKEAIAKLQEVAYGKV